MTYRFPHLGFVELRLTYEPSGCHRIETIYVPLAIKRIRRTVRYAIKDVRLTER